MPAQRRRLPLVGVSQFLRPAPERNKLATIPVKTAEPRVEEAGVTVEEKPLRRKARSSYIPASLTPKAWLSFVGRAG
jgi:hypothetical protein